MPNTIEVQVIETYEIESVLLTDLLEGYLLVAAELGGND